MGHYASTPMNIIFVITNSRGKNLVFVADTLKIYSLKKAIDSARDGSLKNIYPVKSRNGIYLRAKKKISKNNQLDRLSLSSFSLFASKDDIEGALATPSFRAYWHLYQATLSEQTKLIVIDGYPRIAQSAAKSKLLSNKNYIFRAAKQFEIDPHLLAAIIIDEIARAAPIEPIVDLLGVSFLGINTSAGIAQVKIETARDLIAGGYYNPDPLKLNSQYIGKVSRQDLYQYIKASEHSIFFAAARISQLVDEWGSFVDLRQNPAIIATLYSRSYKKPHGNPEPNDRGIQISHEFYSLAKTWLK